VWNSGGEAGGPGSMGMGVAWGRPRMREQTVRMRKYAREGGWGRSSLICSRAWFERWSG